MTIKYKTIKRKDGETFLDKHHKIYNHKPVIIVKKLMNKIFLVSETPWVKTA